MKTEPNMSSCSILPDYLKCRLELNQRQAESYSVSMNDQWIQTMENMKSQYLKGAKEEYRLPKVRLALGDKNRLKTNDDKVCNLNDIFSSRLRMRTMMKRKTNYSMIIIII
jgi:hypothetical protein